MTEDEPDNGGPAFPQTCLDAADVGMVHTGMSMRDYYAGQAMIGFMSELGHSLASDEKPDRAQRAINHTARLSFMVANAMLKERARG